MTTLAALLLSVMLHIRRYVVLSDHQAIAVTLWVAHTHAIDAADCTPYLQITSATKRAGKTRLLEVLEPLVARSWFTGRTSAAALVRKVDAQRPTLLLDESDAAFGGEKEYAEALRGLLNSGYRKSGRATVCVGVGANITARDFSTFCPKAIAGIGTLPDTVADRAIALQLRRRTSDEPCERWRERDGHQQAAPIRDHLETWAASVLGTLRDARPELPTGLGDRLGDVWEPLLAIAGLAGGDWLKSAEHAALTLAGTVTDTDITVELLDDVKDILKDYPPHKDIIATAVLLAALTALEDRPWATWRHDKPISGRGLARLLGPLGIHVDRHQTDEGRVRGYRRDAFNDAITRYLPAHPSKCPDPNASGADSAVFNRPSHSAPDTCDRAIPPIDTRAGTLGHIAGVNTGTEDARRPLFSSDESYCPVCTRDTCEDTAACLRQQSRAFRDLEDVFGPCEHVTVERVQ